MCKSTLRAGAVLGPGGRRPCDLKCRSPARNRNLRAKGRRRRKALKCRVLGGHLGRALLRSIDMLSVIHFHLELWAFAHQMLSAIPLLLPTSGW